MKKIAYIEIDTHAEIAQAFMDIMEGSHDFKVDYYFSKKIKDQVRYNDKSVILSDRSMILDQLKDQNYDLVIIGTVHRFFNVFLAITKKYNTAIVTHNLNFAKASKWDLMKSVFKEDIVYRLKLWLKEGLFHSSGVYQTAAALLVLDEALVSGRYQFLPLFYTKQDEKVPNKILTIVIPGGVSQKRRDYNYIFKTIRALKETQDCEFVFLGKAKDHELRQLKHLSEKLPENIHITYFSERVSAEDFEKWMQKADVLWCPIQQKTAFFNVKETYGLTKMTGNLGDAIIYGKWAVFPANYPSKLNFIIPEKEEVFEQFKKLKNTDFDFHKDYSKNKVLQTLEKALNSIIK